MFVRVCQVGDIVSTSPTLVPALRPDLQGGLLGLGWVLLLAVLPTAMLLLAAGVLLVVLAVLSVLLLL